MLRKLHKHRYVLVMMVSAFYPSVTIVLFVVRVWIQAYGSANQIFMEHYNQIVKHLYSKWTFGVFLIAFGYFSYKWVKHSPRPDSATRLRDWVVQYKNK